MDLTPEEQQLIEALRERQRIAQENVGRPPKIWLYVRWSHADSTASGLTLDTQSRSILDYAGKLREKMPHGTRITQVFVDDATKARKKPFRHRKCGSIIWQHVMPGDAIVAYKMDRSFRNMADMATSLQKWTERNISVHFVADNVTYDDANGRLHAHLLGAFAQHFSDQLSARCKDIAHELRQRGRPNGRPRVWEKYEGVTGWKIRTAKPKLWQTAVMIYLARERHGWTWVTISGWIEALLAKEENRPPILTKEYTARQWPPRRCGDAHKQIRRVMEIDPKLRARLARLVQSQTPLAEAGRHCLPPNMAHSQDQATAGPSR